MKFTRKPHKKLPADNLLAGKILYFSIVYLTGSSSNTLYGKRGCEITLSTEKEDFSFKMNERSSFMLKLTCDENFNYKL